MSVCVSSLNSGMTHVSHLHMTSSALSMMHPFQNHQMAPSTVSLDMSMHSNQSQSQSNSHQLQNSSSSSSSSSGILDLQNDPNPEMLLALITRNKTLEGRIKRMIFLFIENSMPSEKRNFKIKKKDKSNRARLRNFVTAFSNVIY